MKWSGRKSNHAASGWAPLISIVSLHEKHLANSFETSAMPANNSAPPQGLPTYRILTGPDDAAFCHRVSEALALGYLLYGSPAATFNGTNVIVAQAIIWPTMLASV